MAGLRDTDGSYWALIRPICCSQEQVCKCCCLLTTVDGQTFQLPFLYGQESARRVYPGLVLHVNNVHINQSIIWKTSRCSTCMTSKFS